MNRMFLTTQNPGPLALYSELRTQRILRDKYFRELVTAAGFDEYGGDEFGLPRAFFKKAVGVDRKGPIIDGFKGGDSHWEGEVRYFKYTIHGNKPAGTAFGKKLAACPHESPIEGDALRPSLSTAVCQRLGLPTEVFSNGRVGFSQVHMLNGTTLALSIPFDPQELPGDPPEGFTEVTELGFCKLIDEHNASLAVKA